MNIFAITNFSNSIPNFKSLKSKEQTALENDLKTMSATNTLAIMDKMSKVSQISFTGNDKISHGKLDTITLQGILKTSDFEELKTMADEGLLDGHNIESLINYFGIDSNNIETEDDNTNKVIIYSPEDIQEPKQPDSINNDDTLYKAIRNAAGKELFGGFLNTGSSSFNGFI